MFSEVIKRF